MVAALTSRRPLCVWPGAVEVDLREEATRVHVAGPPHEPVVISMSLGTG